ncbi:hypothetical protein HDU76_007688 [Blyttiomyces sp. JEL0837]|nr:hypothetical protein HDU76_007688 [Blyttiomyces sp. JEL0837]
MTRSSDTSNELHPALPKHPTWSINSLLPSTTKTTTNPRIQLPEIERLSRLAGLKIPSSSSEAARLVSDINSLCEMVDPIHQLDTTGVKPFVSMAREIAEHGSVDRLRPDVPVVGTTEGSDNVNDGDDGSRDLSGRELLKFAQRTEENYYYGGRRRDGSKVE